MGCNGPSIGEAAATSLMTILLLKTTIPVNINIAAAMRRRMDSDRIRTMAGRTAALKRQESAFVGLETRTAGYVTFGLSSSYTIAQQHFAHVISVNAFNLGDRLYRNHLSFIKDFAPEIGRGVRLAYTIRFF